MLERFLQKIIRASMALIGAGLGAGVVALLDTLGLLGDFFSGKFIRDKRSFNWTYILAIIQENSLYTE
jgi:hypothetical protein